MEDDKMARESEAIAEVRRALGAQLAAFRLAAELTQGQLARAVFCDRTTITHIEKGRARADERFWQVVDGVCDAGGTLLAAYLELEAAKAELERRQREQRLAVVRAKAAELRGQSDLPASKPPTDASREATTPDDGVASDPMRRRTLMQWGLSTIVAPGLAVDNEVTRQIGLGDVARLRQATVRLWSLDQQHGGETLWQAATVQADIGYQTLEHGTYSEAVGQQLLQAVAQLKVRAGWLAFDAGHHDIARSCYASALSLARQADDSQIEAHALCNMAFQRHVLGQPREALRCAHAAERAAAPLSNATQLAVLPYLRQATAGSLVADASQTDRAITSARNVLDRCAITSNDDNVYAFVRPAEIDGVEATCAIELRRASRAETLLEQAIAHHDDQYARNRSMCRVRLARARLDMGAVDGAAEAAHAALDDLTGQQIVSWRVDSELATVAQRLTQHPTVAGVDSFMDRYAVVRAGSAGNRDETEV